MKLSRLHRVAVICGVGAVGEFVAGIALFGESASALRIASAALIVAASFLTQS